MSCGFSKELPLLFDIVMGGGFMIENTDFITFYLYFSLFLRSSIIYSICDDSPVKHACLSRPSFKLPDTNNYKCLDKFKKILKSYISNESMCNILIFHILITHVVWVGWRLEVVEEVLCDF